MTRVPYLVVWSITLYLAGELSKSNDLWLQGNITR